MDGTEEFTGVLHLSFHSAEMNLIPGDSRLTLFMVCQSLPSISNGCEMSISMGCSPLSQWGLRSLPSLNVYLPPFAAHEGEHFLAAFHHCGRAADEKGFCGRHVDVLFHEFLDVASMSFQAVFRTFGQSNMEILELTGGLERFQLGSEHVVDGRTKSVIDRDGGGFCVDVVLHQGADGGDTGAAGDEHDFFGVLNGEFSKASVGAFDAYFLTRLEGMEEWRHSTFEVYADDEFELAVCPRGIGDGVWTLHEVAPYGGREHDELTRREIK